jgi:hypothetical protein
MEPQKESGPIDKKFALEYKTAGQARRLMAGSG